jgi:ABC-type multidrug transport system fused ATPase/permease subunit
MSHPTPVPTKIAKFNKLTYKKVAPRLIKLVLEEKSLLFFGTLALLGGAGLNLTFPYLIKTYLNQNLSIEQVSSSVTSLSVFLILLFLVQGLCFYYRHYLLQLLGLSVVRKIRSSLYSALISQDISFFDAQKLGDLLSRLGADTEAVQKGVSVNVSVVIRYLIQVIGGLALMLYLSPFLTGLILLLVPLLGVFSVLWSKKLRFFSKELQVTLGELSTKAEEALTAIRVVKIFGSENLEIEKFRTTNDKAYEIGDKRTKIAAIFSSSMVTLLHCSIVVVMWIGVSQVVNSKLSMGDLTAFLLYCTIVAVSFGFLINAWAEFVSALGAGERVYEIIDSAPRVISNNENKNINLDLAPEIEFRNVSFSYPSRPDALALRNINLDFPSGKKIALVGPSGSGKSTLASLIGRLYDPTSGTVLVNGEDLKNVSLASYRSFLAYVPQQPQLFSGSIYDNITYGLQEVESNKLDSILELSALKNTIANLPEGLQTRIGDKGVQLSGGERQRVSIARALIRDPKLLVFDEATSSLDSENENLIKEALERVSKGRTTLIIAHRLSTVKDADLVIVLKDGEVLEQGTHEELILKAGLYKSLVEYQLLDR